MTKFPLLTQFVWSGKRLYQLVLNDKKLYGVYLDNQYPLIATSYASLATWIFGITTYIIIKFLVEFYIIGFSSRYNVFDYIVFIVYITAFEKVIGNIPPFKNFFNKRQKEIDLVRTLITEKASTYIEHHKPADFLELNNRNFVLDIFDIQKTDMTTSSLLSIWSQVDYGQLKILLKEGSNKHFVLTEDNFDKLRDCNYMMLDYISKNKDFNQ
jgi:hypothetical protein